MSTHDIPISIPQQSILNRRPCSFHPPVRNPCSFTPYRGLELCCRCSFLRSPRANSQCLGSARSSDLLEKIQESGDSDHTIILTSGFLHTCLLMDMFWVDRWFSPVYWPAINDHHLRCFPAPWLTNLGWSAEQWWTADIQLLEWLEWTSTAGWSPGTRSNYLDGWDMLGALLERCNL